MSPDTIEEAQVSADRFVVIWDDDAVPTKGVHSQIFDLAGNKVGADIEISPNQGRALSVCSLASGGFVVAFDTPLDATEFGNDGSRFRVVEHAYNADGVLIGSDTETGASDSAEYPVVTETGSGFLLAWQDVAAGTVEARLFGSSSGGNSQTGTPGDDTLTALASGSTLRGLAGNDTLVGMAGDDQLIGGAGNDMMRGAAGGDVISGGQGTDGLFGGNGNDGLIGGQGNDRIDGGAGVDTAQWSGDRGDYRITTDSHGKLTITDINLADGSNEGTDLVTGIEQFQFDGHTYSYSYIMSHLDAVAI